MMLVAVFGGSAGTEAKNHKRKKKKPVERCASFGQQCASYEIRVMTSSAAFALTAAKRAPGRHPEGTRPVGAGRGKPQQRGENRSGVHPDSVLVVGVCGTVVPQDTDNAGVTPTPTAGG